MNLEITKSAIKDINKLDTSARQRILTAINKLPFGDVRRLQGYFNYYRLRVGNFRVIYSIENDTITVSAVLPRGDVYKHI